MEFNPYDPELHRDPYPTYKYLRDEAPVYYNSELNFWALSRYEDVTRALRDPDLFISGKGINVGMGDDNSALNEAVSMLIMMDGEPHKQLRKVLSGAFAPRKVAALEPMVRGITDELLDELCEKDAPDFVLDFSNPLPTIVIADLLGIPRKDRVQFKTWSNAITQFEPETARGIHPGEGAGPAMEVVQYLANMLEERRKNPSDDLLTLLLGIDLDGRPLTQAELLGFGFLLLVAGHETTTNQITNAARLLNLHRDQRDLLIREPDRMKTAVEEFLRFDPPVQGLARTTTQDVEMHGQKIPEGSKVLLLFASANRDERVFEDPDRFDITRQENPHLAFGHGSHFCMGSGLARLEVRTAFERLLARLPNFSLDEEQLVRVRSAPIRGAMRLPMELGL
ncbi:MAG: cytochrome P450 [Deltaproteobacteria bacterium]|nr:cytochrome P450 [Deltaproteobacteria bacterium]MBW2417428.1 cytochrome P450 [Deltaproteobacteria bacterium]